MHSLLSNLNTIMLNVSKQKRGKTKHATHYPGTFSIFWPLFAQGRAEAHCVLAVI